MQKVVKYITKNSIKIINNQKINIYHSNKYIYMKEYKKKI